MLGKLVGFKNEKDSLGYLKMVLMILLVLLLILFWKTKISDNWSLYVFHF